MSTFALRQKHIAIARRDVGRVVDFVGKRVLNLAMNAAQLTKKNVRNFWRKVVTGSDCWSWIGSKSKKGYGQFGLFGSVIGAHRASYLIHFGELPAGKCVLHRCDNPECVNPEHLFLGTLDENNRDRDMKGRQVAPSGERNGLRKNPHRAARGEAQGLARLTEQKVRMIRSKYAHGRSSYRSLASEFLVNFTTICDIVTLKTWRHVT